MTPLEGQLLEWLERFGLELDEHQLRQQLSHIQLLQKWNQRINLTSETGKSLLQFHVCESLWVSRFLPISTGAIADIGSGAGFPGIPLQIMAPDLHFVLLERSFKKCTFLETVLRRTGLHGRVVHGMAEGWGGWAKMDAACIRALTPSPPLLERLAGLCVPLLQLAGPRSASLPPPWVKGLEVEVPFSRARFLVRWECSTWNRT